MNDSDNSIRLINAIADLDEETALLIVKQRIASGENPLRVIESCQIGMQKVGERYERQEYFLAGLVMGGEIFRQATEIIQPRIKQQPAERDICTVLLGTVHGDIHDLGKNIVSMLLEANNFNVIDLGVDVPPEKFMEQIQKTAPHIIGLSGLLTSAHDTMRETVDLVKKEWPGIPIIIGGSQLNDQVFQYVGSHFWTTDAVKGVEICKKIMNTL